jgi:hypothetical protein
MTLERPSDDDLATLAAADVLDAIRTVARALGTKPDQLLMADYLRHAAGDPSLPPVGEAFSQFGSWRRARRLAAAAVDSGDSD